jgi:hypothetical protein
MQICKQILSFKMAAVSLWKLLMGWKTTAAKFVLPIPIFLAYLVPLDVDVTGNITAKIWSLEWI